MHFIIVEMYCNNHIKTELLGSKGQSTHFAEGQTSEQETSKGIPVPYQTHKTIELVFLLAKDCLALVQILDNM